MGNYSYGTYASLPADTADLANVYGAPELAAIAAFDHVYVAAPETDTYTIHQFKDTVTSSTVAVTFKGQSGLAPSTSKVQLQVYNVNTAAWEDALGAGASDNTTAAYTDYTLTASLANTANYLDAGVITWRVYQGSTVDYWPVVGVTKPQHLWPFSQTGDYSDQGSTGGFTLSAAGSGNSFGAGGLILNGSGWATYANNADLCNLSGTSFSILVEFTVPDITSYYGALCAGTRTVDGWAIMATWAAGNIMVSPYGGQYTSNLITAGSNQQVIVSLTGTDGTLTLYHNGSVGYSGSPFSGPNTTAGGFYVGAVSDGYALPGTIKRVAVLKGSYWSDSDVSAIWSSLP